MKISFEFESLKTDWKIVLIHFESINEWRLFNGRENIH